MKYADLYEFAPIGYFTLDQKGLIVEVNLTGAVLLGVERSSLIHKPFFRFVLPEFRHLFYSHHQRVLTTCTGQTCDLKLLKKGDTPFYASLESIAVQDPKGNFTQCRSVVSDITGRKRMESQERLIQELQDALAKIKTLRGLLPICASCKQIRDDKGYWKQLEDYIQEHSDAEFTHGFCPDCMKKLYGIDLDENDASKKE